MRGGKLRHRIDIQQQTRKSNNWTDVVTAIPASATPIRGREYVALQAAQADLSIRFCIRYMPGISPAMRVVWEGRKYPIVEAINVNGIGRELELMCRGDPDA